MPRRTWCLLLGLAGWLVTAGCTFNFDIQPPTFVATGNPFVMRGTATLLEQGGGCPAWIGENGVIYHLFQNRRLSSELFDRVVTPGVTSRLELSVRTDLEVVCQVGTIVEVQSVLEIIE